jgi:beta-galactosidase
MPDAMQEYRIKALKEFGCNIYRCSHNPPTPELLDACDRLGMLVIDENRLMGVSSAHYEYLKRLMLRDRNHPSIISWSIGNEEWGIEGNDLGASIAASMQAFAKTIDTTRYITAAISGGWQKGISNVIDVMGVNYIGQIKTDVHHAEFPLQPMWGTEEGSTRTVRGIYFDDMAQHYYSAYDKKPNPAFYSIEDAWKFYVARDYLAGMIIWTGFDYRGEPTPFGWPSVYSLHGMMDLCGFPKDIVYYLRSWWTDIPTLHIFPYWNWEGKAGQEIDVWVYSNCEEVELLLNKKSLGKKPMQKNGHLEWKVKYAKGTLQAIGYRSGKSSISDMVKTTGEPSMITLQTQQKTIKADKEDVAVITVAVNDINNLSVPVANNEISFSIQGPGKIIGVGNGNPTSLEADKYLETIRTVKIENLKEKAVSSLTNLSETSAEINEADWKPAFTDDRNEKFGLNTKALVYRGTFSLPDNFKEAMSTFFYKNIGIEQSIFINGKEIAPAFKESNKQGYILNISDLRAGNNSIAISATPLLKKYEWDIVNQDPGLIQLIFPATQWKRKLFNGLAQIIVQSTGEQGEILLTASSEGLKQQVLKIQALPVVKRPAVD